MASGIHKLTAMAVQKAKDPGYYGDGGGLWLQISKLGGRSWVFRFRINDKSREMGLGPLHTITLSEARTKALECRKVVMEGLDPIEKRNVQRLQNKLQAESNKTFAECASAYINSHKAGWKNGKNSKQWSSSLETYAFPFIGKLPVSAINTNLVLKVLEPIWHEKTETASRVRGRIESILDWAAIKNYRSGDNPARWKGYLDNILPARNKVQKVQHLAALPYRDIHKFMVELGSRDGITARSLEFAILTAARSGEVRGAIWSEIDFENKIWTIPASRMKAGKEHRVPLCEAALNLLKTLPKVTGTKYVFPAPRKNQLSDMALTSVLKRMERKDLTQHGFRSTFRDWAAETTSYPREVIEHALAHQLKDKAEAAYQRGDLLAKRALLMADWATYCKNASN